MKKIMIMSFVAMGATAAMTSCGQGAAKITTTEDSLAYSIGVDVASGVYRFDTTLNVDVFVQAIRDVYAKDGKMTYEQAQAFIGEYMSVGFVRKKKQESAAYLAEMEKESGVKKSETGLLYNITVPGNDSKPAVGDSIVVNYTLTTPDGNVLDQSPAGEPRSFILDPNGLIKAWIEGMPLIGEGGKVTLYVPSDLAYGDQGRQGIAPGQALKFEIELVGVTKK